MPGHCPGCPWTIDSCAKTNLNIINHVGTHIIFENQIILVYIVMVEANFLKFSIGFGDSIPRGGLPWKVGRGARRYF